MTTHRILKRFSIFALLVTSPNGAEAKKKKKKKHVSAADWEERFPVPPKPETSPLCDACQFSAIKVKQLYEQGSSGETVGITEWIKAIQEGCDGLPGCAPLVAKHSRALAGLMMDLVDDGDAASTWGMSLLDFQREVCGELTENELCQDPSNNVASVRRAAFTVPASAASSSSGVGGSGGAVALFVVGKDGGGFDGAGRAIPVKSKQPAEALALVLPGQTVVLTPETPGVKRGNFDFREGLRLRALPLDDMPCSAEAHGGACQAPCADPNKQKEKDADAQDTSAEADVRACPYAHSMCRRTPGCVMVHRKDGDTKATLKKLGLGWESVQASDFILESGLEQEFMIRPRAGFDASLPEVVPDPSASPPQEWDEGEDGPWEAPLVPNTEALGRNPRLEVEVIPRNGEPRPARQPTQTTTQAGPAPVEKQPKKGAKKARKAKTGSEL